MPRKLNKRSRGTRTNTATETAPAPTAADSSAGGTPLASVATIESVRDTPPTVSQESYATDFGHIYHDYDVFAPNADRVQLMWRVVEYHPKGAHGTAISLVGSERINDFYTNLYDELLRKAVTRDGYRHLPDTLAIANTPIARYALWVGAVINVRTIIALIDSISWNEGTRTLSAELSRKNRRAMEEWNFLAGFQVPNLYRMQAMMQPVVSDKPGGAVLATFVRNEDWFAALGTLDGSHKPCLTWSTGSKSDALDSNMVDDILKEVENVIKILNSADDDKTIILAIDGDTTNPSFTWTATGIGGRDDMRYFDTLVRELVYPSGLPEPGQIVVDPGLFTHTLYGDAAYGSQHKSSDYTAVGFPFIDNCPSGMVYRRGYLPASTLIYAGLRDIWAVKVEHNTVGTDTNGFLGGFLQIKAPNKGDNNCWKMWSRATGWADAIIDINYDDGDSLRGWMQDGSPMSDHQWNEMLGAVEGTLPQHGPVGPKAFAFFQPIGDPLEMLRAAHCAAWNLPFVR